ncbi:MAG: redoxin domain-containing protein [Verrucomicrobiales bacterium]|nr:redoxin domain-containing protein [Verrucomicrobiota bacterium JB025]
MRILPTCAAALVVATTTLAAQPNPAAREQAIDELLSIRESITELETAITKARGQGIGEQAILEARFLYHVDHQDDAAIAAMLPAILERDKTFQLEESAIFGVREDWLAVVQYVRAIDCLRKNDKAGFKKHITEAFWLSPGQAAAYAPYIDRLRLNEAMATVKLDLKTSLNRIDRDQSVALESLLGKNQALVLHFWSPWNPECEAAMPDFITTSATLAKHGIPVASILPESSADHIARAAESIAALGDKSAGNWLADSTDRILVRQLRINQLPTMVIVSPGGGILFNGSPSDPAFWSTLAKVSPGIPRPSSN